ncbi:MAG: MFS transporter [Bacilli bacterium]|nr:MFS transporter [Bacilli bacterium]
MNKMQKISILSISLLSIMSSAAISPALSYIGDYFYNSSELMIKMVVSLPAIFIIPVTLLTGRLTSYIKKKTLVYMGLTLYLVGGLGGAVANSIVVLLVFRSLLGIGTGLLIPLMRGVIADFFDGKERVQMMGYASAVNNLGGIIATLFGGILTIYGWRYPFLVYIVGLFVLFLVIKYMPDHPLEKKESRSVSINRNVWMIGLSHYMMVLIFFAVPSGLSYYISESGLGTGVTTGVLISLVTLGSFITGLNFHTLKVFLGDSTVIVGLGLETFGMLGIGLSSNLIGVSIALLLVGIGIGILSPNIYLKTSLESSKEDVTLALAIAACFSFLGQFSSPLINEYIQDFFHFNRVDSTFYISFGIGVFSIIIILLNKVFKVYIPKHVE